MTCHVIGEVCHRVIERFDVPLDFSLQAFGFGGVVRKTAIEYNDAITDLKLRVARDAEGGRPYSPQVGVTREGDRDVQGCALRSARCRILPS